MKEQSLKKLSNDELLKAFASAALDHEMAIKGANAQSADHFNERTQDLFDTLVNRGQRRLILALLDHAEPIVRLFAAAKAIDFDPDAAAPVLEQLVRRDEGIASLDAEAILDMWRGGEDE